MPDHQYLARKLARGRLWLRPMPMWQEVVSPGMFSLGLDQSISPGYQLRTKIAHFSRLTGMASAMVFLTFSSVRERSWGSLPV